MNNIYIHIPFCRRACHYCDFHFSTSKRFMPQVVWAIGEELKLAAKTFKFGHLSTIYFGGGTPSLLPITFFNYLDQILKDNFELSQNLEYSLEANPEDLSPEKTEAWAYAGVNRISLGMQSIHNHILKFLNRAHTPEQVEKAVIQIKKAGINNITVDVIYDIPNLTDANLTECLHFIEAFSIPHFSAYALTIEPDTLFGRWQQKEKIDFESNIPEGNNQFYLIRNFALQKGFAHYELSNYGKPGFFSQHNQMYWAYKPYYAAGPGAFGFYNKTRTNNIANNYKYYKNIQAAIIPAQREYLSDKEWVNEKIFTGLRWHKGLNINRLPTNYGQNEAFNKLLYKFCNEGLLTIQNSTVTLSPKGMPWADYITRQLFF